MKTNPMQPISIINGHRRFKENKIVRYLLDNGGIDLNRLAVLDFTADDRMQFAQLIGYSLGGYSELSYVTDYSVSVANSMADSGKSEQEIRIEYLEKELNDLRVDLREPMARLFGIHPDDLNREIKQK